MERVDVLLVGGGVASARCARALRRHGFEGTIALVGAEAVPPYNRPPLSKELLRDDLPDELVLAESEGWYERRGVDLRTGATVVELDAGERSVRLDDGTSIAFGRCLLGTGAAPRELPVPGGEGAMLLRTLADARQLRSAAVQAGAGERVTVVGGGFIGVEVASALATLGLAPTIVEMTGRLWGGALGSELAAWGTIRLAAVGVAVRAGSVTRLDAVSAWIDDDRLPHSFALAGIGVVPRVELAERAGLEVADGIVVDPAQRTSHASIWSAGDVARAGPRRVEHWHAAREAGERAALSMLGLPPTPHRVPWVFSEVGGVALDVIGAAEGWDDERWLAGGSVLAFLDGSRVVQLAVIGSALEPERGRAIVEAEASLATLEAALAGG
jgi:3-phenylpropionate/trans-cinnamate dioxygenase ferredoxin reductase subunit